MPKELKLVAIIAAVTLVMLYLYEKEIIFGGSTSTAALSNTGY